MFDVRVMTKDEFSRFINEWDRLTDAGDPEAIRALKAPVQDAMAFGGFKDLSSYLQACAQVSAALGEG